MLAFSIRCVRLAPAVLGPAVGVIALLGWGAVPLAQQAVPPAQTLRVVMSGALAILDPVNSTAPQTRNHGFLVYDQLFAFDSQGVARPQMVESVDVSPDGMTHRFTLREGLAFHDGQPVRAADAVASIRRWSSRDIAGRALASATAAMEVVDERTFTIRLSRPFGFVAEALARPTASALFVMPERLARTPADMPITDATGSGPFVFQGSEFRPGDRAVYVRNPAYRPRPEPADGLAGGKVARVERIEWLAVPDAATAAAALQAGEVDFLETPVPDLLPTLARNRRVRLFAQNPVGFMLWLRPNHLQPPFNDPRARQALLFLTDQQANLQAAGIPASEQVPYCPAYFLCGTPLESVAGARGLRSPDFARAQALLQEAGYDGRKVVVLNPSDNPTLGAATQVLAENMRRAGMNVDLATMDFATVVARRNRREPVEQGGWNIFITVASVLDAQNPLVNVYLGSPCDGGLSGWPCDEKLEHLRRAWWEEPDPARRPAILEQVHTRAYEVLSYINAGQFRALVAHRDNVEGLRPTTVPVFWGVIKR